MGDHEKPGDLAKIYRQELTNKIKELEAQGIRGGAITLAGVMCDPDKPILTYSKYAKKACEEIGVRYREYKFTPDTLESEIKKLNEAPNIHGILIFYPAFRDYRDQTLRDKVSELKDIEGLNTFWMEKLKNNERIADDINQIKAILPCTPLGIMKLIEETSYYDNSKTLPLDNKVVAVFNRSEVVGKPLAFMLANDGADVYSFDVDGCLLIAHSNRPMPTECKTPSQRAEILQTCDIIITGVPDPRFNLVQANEISEKTLGINFSTVRNFTDDAMEKCEIYIPRVGPMTITMALRNLLRLYRLSCIDGLSETKFQ